MGDKKDFKKTVTPPTVDPGQAHIDQLRALRGSASGSPEPASAVQSRIHQESPDIYGAILTEALALARERRQDTEGLTLRLSPSIKRRLRRHAADHGYSHNLSALVEVLLDAYLPNDVAALPPHEITTSQPHEARALQSRETANS